MPTTIVQTGTWSFSDIDDTMHQGPRCLVQVVDDKCVTLPAVELCLDLEDSAHAAKVLADDFSGMRENALSLNAAASFVTNATICDRHFLESGSGGKKGLVEVICIREIKELIQDSFRLNFPDVDLAELIATADAFYDVTLLPQVA